MVSHKAGSTATARNPSSSGIAAPEPDFEEALRRVMELMAISGTSCRETPVVDYLRQQLSAAGADPEWLTTDTAHQRTPQAGETGNLVLRLPGTSAGPRRLLMAHMDTVPLCVGSQPVRDGEVIRSADPRTGLGADDRAGVAVILQAALEILRRGLPHPPLTFLWSVQEEIGLHGARHVDVEQLAEPRLAFNWDGGEAQRLVIGATGAYRMVIQVSGLASHAGGAPEYGVSAVAIASLAIAELHRQGWHGLVQQGERIGTSNIGYFHGGAATNVVTDEVEIWAEARSHEPAFRQEIAEAIEGAFQRAAAEVKNANGVVGSVQCQRRLDYDSFCLPSDEPVVRAAEQAVRGVALQPELTICNGGLDANWLTARGIPTVTLGCGQRNVHTVNEQLDLADFRHACQIALRLATATE